MTLNNSEKKNYIKNNFHQYFDLELNEDLSTTETVNLIIPLENLSQSNINELSKLSSFFNSDKTNVVFTPQNDLNTLYRFEIYNDVYFIKLKPYSQNIRMHILPKAYDCSTKVLFLKDDMLEKRTQSLTSDYIYKENDEYINSYYAPNNNIRDKTTIPQNDKAYKHNKWGITFCNFSYDISALTKSMSNIQICAGYKYNNSNPYYTIHYTGVKDNTNLRIEDRCTLIDANYDNIEENRTDITQFHYDSNNNLYVPKVDRDIRSGYNSTVDHTIDENVGKTFHKIVKYINDTIYSEENKEFAVGTWKDLSEVEE